MEEPRDCKHCGEPVDDSSADHQDPGLHADCASRYWEERRQCYLEDQADARREERLMREWGSKS